MIGTRQAARSQPSCIAAAATLEQLWSRWLFEVSWRAHWILVELRKARDLRVLVMATETMMMVASSLVELGKMRDQRGSRALVGLEVAQKVACLRT